jgi:hypothetical protein
MINRYNCINDIKTCFILKNYVLLFGQQYYWAVKKKVPLAFSKGRDILKRRYPFSLMTASKSVPVKGLKNLAALHGKLFSILVPSPLEGSSTSR